MSTATNNLVKTLSEINPEDVPSFSSTKDLSVGSNGSDSAASSSIMDFFSDITWQTWLIVILILAFLGINVFSYLEMGTEKIADFFGPIFKLLGYQTLEITKQMLSIF